MVKLKTPYKISLDFYKRNIVTVNAKQLDHNSRYIEITCTDNGKKVVLDNTTTFAYVRFKKADGHNVLNEVEITDSGIVNVELTQQMLMVSGQNTVDIMFIQTHDEKKALIENLEDIISSDENSENFSVLSTMSFYVNTEATAIDHGEVVSSNEYDALTIGLANTKDAIENANTQASNAEEWAVKAETATTNANTAATNAQAQADNAEEWAVKAETATDYAYAQAGAAKTQADRASEAADKIDAIIAGEVIMQDEKGAINGVATLDENTLIPNEQINTQFDETMLLRELINSGDSLDVILRKIYTYMKTINSMSQKSSNSIESLPILTASSSVPTDGDAYEVNYNTGVTINPSEKSINTSSLNAFEKVTIGNVTLNCEDIDSEKRLVISFT